MKMSNLKSKNKNISKGGSMHENIEKNDEYLDEFHKNDKIKMELAMQIISINQKLRSYIEQDLKEFNSQSLSNQVKKREQLVFMMPAIKKTSDLLADDRVELSTKIDASKDKVGVYHEKWLQKTKTRLLKQIDDEKRASLIVSRMKKQMEKH